MITLSEALDAVCWQSQGRLDEAIESYRTATRLCPDNAAQHSELLYALNYHPAFDAAAIFAEHRAWAQHHADPLTNECVATSFEREGVASDRVELCQRRSPRDYLELVNRADLALDPFPFNGHTTACDALWQGVGVVSLAGSAYASRFGSSALMTLGLDDLVATTQEEYISVAVRLANDRPRLADLRGNLRGRMRRSPLVDNAGFTRELEAAYLAMWQAWCAGDSPASVALKYETHHR